MQRSAAAGPSTECDAAETETIWPQRMRSKFTSMKTMMRTTELQRTCLKTSSAWLTRLKRCVRLLLLCTIWPSVLQWQPFYAKRSYCVHFSCVVPWCFGYRAFSLPGQFVPRSESANRTLANSLPGTFAPWPSRSLANSLPGPFVPRPFRSLELSLP